MEYMDLEIFKGSRFFTCGKLDIKLHQKKENKFLYLPYHSGHAKNSIKNYVIEDLRRYVRSNTKEIIFLGIKVKFMNVYWTGDSKNGNSPVCSIKSSFQTEQSCFCRKISCAILKLQMIPEHLLERNLDSAWDCQLLKVIDASCLMKEGPQTLSW